MSVSKSCLANTGQRAKKRDHHKYKRAHTSLDGVTTVEKDAMIAPHLFYMVIFAVCGDKIKVFFLARSGPRIATARSGST